MNRPSGSSTLMLQPHLLQVNSMSAIRGRTWLMRVTVPFRVANLPAQERGTTDGRCAWWRSEKTEPMHTYNKTSLAKTDQPKAFHGFGMCPAFCNMQTSH